jgi:S1-C subfamily serine protease
MTLKDCLILTLLNVVGFYGLKYYNDSRQCRIVETLLPSVVKVSPIGHRWSEQLIMTPEGLGIEKVYKGFGVMGHGSGVFVSKDGMILTCNHAVAEGPIAQIETNDGKKALAYVVGRDVEQDLALLRPIKPLGRVVPVSMAKGVKRGLNVLTIGFPGPFDKYVTAGVVSGFQDERTFSDLAIAPGNSGGGVFTINGDIIGLAEAMTGPFPIPTYQGFSILTSLEATQEILEKYRGF